MIDLKERAHSLLSNHPQILGVLDTFGPANWSQRRRDSFAAFEAVGFPTHKDEEWKYTPLNLLKETEYKPAYGATVERTAFDATPVGKVDAATVAFVNGQEAPELAIPLNLPNGVFVGTLQQAIEEIPELSSVGSARSPHTMASLAAPTTIASSI